MNALTQYIDLYESHRDTINAHSVEALNVRRESALQTLRGIGRLPERGDEGYAKVSLNDIFAPDFGINITRVPFAAAEADAKGCDIPNVGSLRVMVVNDTVQLSEATERLLPEGVEVMSLAQAAVKYPEEFAHSAAPESHPVVALNTMLVQDGVYIKVKRGVHCERPVQILSTFNASQPMMGVRRIKIVVEDGAEATVLACDHPRLTNVDYLSCRVVELSLGRDAVLNFYDLEEATPQCNRVSILGAEQAAGSNVNIDAVSLNGAVSRNEFYVRHLGDYCNTHIGGMVIAGGRQVVDNATYVTHDHEHCTSSQLFKYALFDEAQGAFEGLVTVEEQARFTDAKQSNRNLLVSPDARMHAMPQLVIYCDEVKASHGSATGQLDEDALFYMQSRGIGLGEARMLLINAFMAEVLDCINHEPLRDRLRHLVEKRLRGCASSTCGGCHIKH